MYRSSSTTKQHRYGFTLIELLIVVAIIAILAAIAVPNFLEAQMRAKITRVKSDFRSIGIAIESYVVDWDIPPVCKTDQPQTQNKGVGGITNPISGYNDVIMCFTGLTTPQAYLPSVAGFTDPFVTGQGQLGDASAYMFLNWHGIYRALATGTAPNPFYTGGHPGGSVTLATAYMRSPVYLYFDQTDMGIPATWTLTAAGPDRTLRDAKSWVDPNDHSRGENYTSVLWVGSQWAWGDYTNPPGFAHLYDATNGTRSTGNIWRFSSGSGPAE